MELESAPTGTLQGQDLDTGANSDGAQGDRAERVPGVSTERVRVRVEWEYAPNRARHHVGCGGDVHLHEGRPRCGSCGMVDDNAGWIKRLLMWNWHWLSLDGWPGWDVIGTGHDRHPPFVKIAVKHKGGKSSHQIAIEWDDVATGLFYHRDWTDDGLPTVRDGDTYHAGFWFQHMADRDAFVARYGGDPS